MLGIRQDNVAMTFSDLKKKKKKAFLFFVEAGDKPKEWTELRNTHDQKPWQQFRGLHKDIILFSDDSHGLAVAPVLECHLTAAWTLLAVQLEQY